jgi:glycosyltransferase involved in cell wall biosynthesis
LNRPAPELVVLSHLPWTFVWQRPQHLISRLARDSHAWFAEEPVLADVDAPRLRTEEHGPITRVWYEVPSAGRRRSRFLGDEAHPSFDAEGAEGYAAALAERVGADRPVVAWLYTPLALPLASALQPAALVYDVMDDLAAFANARPAQRVLQRRALTEADVVFTGGRSLHAGVREAAPGRTFLFPSGVEPEHYAPARTQREPRERPVAGYVGVIDERLDLELIAGLAERLPDWDLELVGPVAKIDPAALPQAPNLRYPGMQPYERLPAVMAGFDVALMPFALNEATRSISPTKTLEYLAAGLPVVSTPVPDVIADFGTVVRIAAEPEAFAAACLHALAEPLEDRDRKLRRIERRYQWDDIAVRIHRIMQDALSASAPASPAQSSTGVTA